MALRSPSIFLKGFQTSIPLVKIIHLKISSIMKINSTHKKLFQMLVLGDFAHQLASQIYPYEENRNVINYQAMDEVTDPGTDFDPSDITTKCRHDAILSFFPEYGRTARPLDKNLGESWFTHVSIEFKNSLSDLLKNGSRMVQYLGATDYFFLGVPKNLLPDAVQLLQRKPLSDHADQIGLVDLTKGDRSSSCPVARKRKTSCVRRSSASASTSSTNATVTPMPFTRSAQRSPTRRTGYGSRK